MALAPLLSSHLQLHRTSLCNNIPPTYHKYNTKRIPLKIITASAGAMTKECSKTQKPKRLRTSSYTKTLSSIYADMNDLCSQGLLNEALNALDNTQFRGGIPVDANMYEILLQACAKSKALEEGKRVHAHMKLNRLDRYESLRTKLVKMYGSCGAIEDARQVFDKTPQPRSLQLWNAMIRAYVRKGFSEEKAIGIYREMRLAGVKGDRSTFSTVLKACRAVADLEQGKEVHGDIIGSRFESDVVVGTALVDMYARCGSVEDARQVFDNMPQRNVVTWTAMISGLGYSGLWEETLHFFRQMQGESERPNSVTLAAGLNACCNTGDLQKGKEIHSYAIRNGFDGYAFVGNGLIGMYCKCDLVGAAREVFDKMAERNMASYNTMILGYAQNGYAKKTLEIFRQIGWDGLKPNPVAVANVLPACGDLADLQKGKEIHSYIIRWGFEFNAFVCCALIDMYSKCGRIEAAHGVFDRMSERDVVSWTTMIAGYGMNGDCKEALELFNQMQESELEADCKTLLAVLSAFCHAGLVDEGCQFFESMIQNYHITLRVEHYVCMVELLDRAGHLNKAFDLIQSMPLEPDVGEWGALLAACRVNSNIKTGEHNAQLLE